MIRYERDDEGIVTLTMDDPGAGARLARSIRVEAAVALLVTIDPVGTGPIFAALTRGSDDAHRRRMAVKGVLIAAGILFVTEAGGTVTTIEQDGDPKTGSTILATNAELHPQLRKVLQGA